MSKRAPAASVDRGWAWVILLAASFGSILVSLGYTGGIFNIIFLEVFGRSKQTTAWITAIQGAVWSFGCPLSSLMVRVLGARWTCILGGLIGASGYFVTCFSNSFGLTFFSFGILLGLGLAISYVPIILITSDYFEKKKNLAFGLTTTAVAFGTLVLPKIIISVNEYYGWRSCMLILTGLFLHVVVAGALFRPQRTVSVHEVVLSPDKLRSDGADQQNYTADYVDSDSTHSGAILKLESEVAIVDNTDDSVQAKEGPGQLKKHPFRFLSKPEFLLLCGSLCAANAAIFSCYIHFPAYFVQNGGTNDTMANCLMGLGVANLLSRLIGSVATNSPDIEVILVYITSCGLSGILMFFCPMMAKGFAGQFAFATLFGYFGTWYFALLAPVTIDILGEEDLTLAFGFENFVGGFGSLIGPPLTGFMFMSSAVMMMCVPLVTRKVQRPTNAESREENA